MASKKLTDSRVKALRPKAKRYEVWDKTGATGSFGLRVSPAGKKSFIAMYRHQGVLRRWTIGRYPQMSVSEAREAFIAAMHRLERHGTDPAAEKIARRRAEEKAPTVATLADRYIQRHDKRFKRESSVKLDQAALDKYILPAWSHRKAKSIQKREVRELVTDIADHAPIAANRVLSLLRKMFNFGIEWDYVPANPCDHISKPAPENRRDRVLSEAEIKTFWQGLDAPSRMAPETKLALRFILATGQRPGECSAAPWSEIDGRWWTIPAERYKTNRQQRVYLSDTAMQILGESRERFGQGKWVFPSSRTGTHLDAGTLTRSLKRRKHFDLPHFTPHDLRRTVASLCGKLKIQPHVIDRILGHVVGGVAGVYRTYTYDDEMAEALQKWSGALDAIVAGETIADYMQRSQPDNLPAVAVFVHRNNAGSVVV